jgi:hypothetical protein
MAMKINNYGQYADIASISNYIQKFYANLQVQTTKNVALLKNRILRHKKSSQGKKLKNNIDSGKHHRYHKFFAKVQGITARFSSF